MLLLLLLLEVLAELLLPLIFSQPVVQTLLLLEHLIGTTGTSGPIVAAGGLIEKLMGVASLGGEK